MVRRGGMRLERGDSSAREEPTPETGGHLPSAPALSLTAWPERVGLLEEERTSLGVRGQSSFDSCVEGQGPLPGGVPGQRWGFGKTVDTQLQPWL